MTVVDPEVTAARTQEGAIELELVVPADLLYFDGHFPDVPVLPGVVQVHWAMKYARERLGVTGDFAGIDRLKFHRIIVPGQAVTLALQVQPGRGDLSFRFTSESGAHSGGRIRFA